MTQSQGSSRRPSRSVPAAFAPLALPALAVVALLAVTVAGCGKLGGGSPALVTVGTHKISVADFEAYARDPQVIQPYLALPESLQKQRLLDDIVTYELIAEAARKQGLDKDSAYAKVATDMLPRLLPDALYERKIGSMVKVSDAEAKLYDEGNATEYRLAVIMTTDSTAMQPLVARLARGEKFETVAHTGSQDPETARNGGVIDTWLSPGQLPPDVEKALRPLKKGQRTGVIHQRNGSYLFEVLDTRPREETAPFEMRRAQIITELENRKRSTLADDYLAGLKRQYDLKIEGKGWDVVDQVILPLPDSLTKYLAMDPAKVGLTAGQLSAALATWKGRTYAVSDWLKDMTMTPLQDRPPSTRHDLIKQFVEGKAMSEILQTEAKALKLEESPAVKRQIAHAQTSWLVGRYLERNLPMSAEYPTPAQLDSITASLLSHAQGGPPGMQNMTYSMLPPQVQQQIVMQWQQTQRQKRLEAEVARLKKEIPVKTDEARLKSIPWPVPAEGKEKA